MDIDGLPSVFLLNELFDGAMLVLGHLFHQVIAFRVNGRVIERVLSSRDAEEAGTLLKGRGS